MLFQFPRIFSSFIFKCMKQIPVSDQMNFSSFVDKICLSDSELDAI